LLNIKNDKKGTFSTYYAFLFPKRQECFADAEKDMCEAFFSECYSKLLYRAFSI